MGCNGSPESTSGAGFVCVIFLRDSPEKKRVIHPHHPHHLVLLLQCTIEPRMAGFVFLSMNWEVCEVCEGLRVGELPILGKAAIAGALQCLGSYHTHYYNIYIYNQYKIPPC